MATGVPIIGACATCRFAALWNSKAASHRRSARPIARPTGSSSAATGCWWSWDRRRHSPRTTCAYRRAPPGRDLPISRRCAKAKACSGRACKEPSISGGLAVPTAGRRSYRWRPARPPDALRFESLRTLFSVLEDAHFALAGRAVQLIDWDRNHRFCGRCATPTVTRAAERARECPACGLSSYPRIAPAVMALVRRGHKLLLARGPHFPPGMYSALAGFAEPGESLEQCLAREVAEEVGVQVSQIRYFASQPWPFPNSLMVAFHCEWAGGEIRPQDGEIESAGWFDVSQLPTLPSRISIARRLIDSAVSELRGPLE
ncbi:NAD(+) diphosphatase [Haliangium sp. UPWRP_2]|nr:NAD(+) diphosphatase [Haliangium sp. UPWRP_2]